MRRRTISSLAAALAVAAAIWGAAAQASPAPVATQPAAKTPGAIAVHGRWVITVRNKRGKIVQRRRFENSLTQDGSQALVDVLTGAETIDTNRDWLVSVFYNTSAGPTNLAFVSNNSGDGPLTVTDEDASHGGPAIVLTSGTAPAADTGSIYKVSTVVFFASGRSATFTERTLDTPINVAAGQLVSATVTITFS